MATHSSTLAWKIPWMEKHGRLQSMGLQRVGHDLATSVSSLSPLSHPPANVRNMGSIPGSGRSRGGGNGYPLQYSYLGNPIDRRA